MKQTRLMMGMPITVELADSAASAALIDEVYRWFGYVDATFSTYKPNSEISRLNNQQLTLTAANPDVQLIFNALKKVSPNSP